jgi:hypothetical protein
MPKNVFLYLVAAILLTAAAVQVAPFLFPAVITKEKPLEELISAHIAGWQMEILPLGQTEEVRNAVERRLRFDDVLSRIYTRGNHQVGVYIAYWAPGTMPVRQVGVHTPDTCWVQNGWTCAERESQVTTAVGGTAIKPAEFGIFDFDTARQHVLFWHIVGNRIHTYEQQGMHSMTAAWTDTLQYGLNQRQEQFFIRISSNRPFEEIWEDAGFQQLMSEVAALGLVVQEEEEPPLVTVGL